VGLGANRLPGITGSIGIAGTRIDATLDWPLLPPQALRGSAWFDAAPGTAENPAGPHGAFQAQLPATTIDDPNKLASLLAPFHGITFTGTLAAKINLAFSAAVLVPLIHADLSDATLAMPQRGIGLEGVRGSLTINSLSPLASPGDQRLDIAKVRFNKFVVADNTLAYRIEDAHSLFLERYQGSWAGGHLYTYALRLDPAHPVLDATLFFDNLQLDQMLATVAPDYASGQGRLYGRLPVRVAWPHVTLGSGFLYAAPGGGTLRVQQAQDLAPAVDQSNLANVKQSLLAALNRHHRPRPRRPHPHRGQTPHRQPDRRR
jgi:hypothetical protein